MVDSDPTTGKRFRVLFPTAAAGGAADATDATARYPELGHAGPEATVLVVDDEPTLRSVIRRSLLRAGYEVLVAEDGPRALALSRAHPTHIDLLITDVVMPGLTGPELARELWSERHGLSVLFISGFTFEEAVPLTDLANGSASAYLPKPFDTKVLLAKVDELLRASPRGTLGPHQLQEPQYRVD